MTNSNLNYECKVENKSAIARELTITVKPESIQKYVEKQLAELQKKAKLDGFRKGKAPISMIKRQFMNDVKNDVFSKVVQDSYVQALVDNKINAIGNPKIEPKSGIELNEGETLVYVANVEVLPEMKPIDFSKIKVSAPSKEVKAAEVEKTIEDLRKSRSDVEPDEKKEGPVKDADFVSISFFGTLNGQALDSLKGEHRLLKMGAGHYLDGFEKNILGMKKGESKKFTITFPENYDKEFAGKQAEFEVTVHEFKKEVMPAFDDEFAKQFKCETAAELKKKIEEDMIKNAERKARTTLKERTVDALIEANKFDVPQHFLNMQMDHLVRENARTLLQQGYTEKMVREFLDKNKEELKTRADKQVRSTLILDKIAADNNITIQDADMEREYARIADEEKVELAEVLKFFENEEAKREMRFRLKEERTFDLVLEKVKVTQEK